MTDFRHRKPTRRENQEAKSHYTDYRPELREDFNERCGYCGDHDFFRQTYYEIDHFVPRKKLKTIALNDYSNLVYSCRSCNNSKRAKWPTGDEKVHNNGKVGFIDPCDETYADQFHRGKDGSIIARTELGEWMWKALNFGNPAHRVIWNLEEIRKRIRQMEESCSDGVVDSHLAADIMRFTKQYLVFEESLRGVPHF